MPIMQFELVVPARNEEANIKDALMRLVKALNDMEANEWKVVVAVNGTTDFTLERVEEFKNQNVRYAIEVVECPSIGKGAAIKYSAQKSQADYFGFIDADLSADPEMILPMLKKVTAGECDVAIGSRLLETKTTNRGWSRTLSSQLFNFVAWLLLGLEVKDAQCGLKIMNAKARNILGACNEDGWFLDIEFLAKLRQDALRVAEVPVSWIEFRYADRRSQVRMFRDGFEAIKAFCRIRKSGLTRGSGLKKYV